MCEAFKYENLGGETGERQPGAVPTPIAKPNENGTLVPVNNEKVNCSQI